MVSQGIRTVKGNTWSVFETKCVKEVKAVWCVGRARTLQIKDIEPHKCRHCFLFPHESLVYLTSPVDLQREHRRDPEGTGDFWQLVDQLLLKPLGLEKFCSTWLSWCFSPVLLLSSSLLLVSRRLHLCDEFGFQASGSSRVLGPLSPPPSGSVKSHPWVGASTHTLVHARTHAHAAHTHSLEESHGLREASY